MIKSKKQEAKARIRRLNFYANWILRNPDKIQDLELAKGAYDFCKNHIAQTKKDIKKDRPARRSALSSRLRSLVMSIVAQNRSNVKDGASDV